MFRTLKARWRAFLAVPRGQRFQAHHRRTHRADAKRWARYVAIAAALVVIALGIVLLVLPGPGLLVMIGGAVLLAEESAFVARGLDRLDLLAARVASFWRARRARRSAGGAVEDAVPVRARDGASPDRSRR
ncbi:MAG TPA: PGPGW domain-containing protein [Dokdonella sp.]|nr:PGPGW domain-containing protein [Dokdonella sp.]